MEMRASGCHPMLLRLHRMLDFWLASLLGQNYSVVFVAAVVDYDDD
jgi:hypothetical protein